MIEETYTFSGSFNETSQQDSVPPVLRALIDMVLYGPSIQTQMDGHSSQAASTIAQLIKFNGHRTYKKGTTTKNPEQATRHSTMCETLAPALLYIDMMLNAETRNRGLIDKLFNMGISISYDRVLWFSAELGNQACQLYHKEGVVCPPTL